ncbi:MAG: Sec-independent protein translocase protein TatC, partial [Alphaproteobacteria bacterium MarineAlpha9_Bin1]
MTSDIKGDKEVEESKAPLISHLIELRDRLKWAAVAFFIAFIFSYFFKEYIYGFLVKPLAQIYEEAGIE